MKKIIFSISLCLIGYVTIAQEIDDVYNAAYVNKRGVYLLPQAGDFALGFDASPLLRYVGNFFSSGGNSAPILSDQTIYGKYFLADNRAIRARLSLGLSNSVDKGFVTKDTNPDATVTDFQRTSESNVMLGIGYELRRGNGRVQGFLGGEVMLGFEGGKLKYEYGNRMDEDNKSPTYYDFGENWILNNQRVTESKFGNYFFGGLGAFTGVEYFFAPQLSLGCEVGLGFLFSTTGQSQTTVEKWDMVDDERKVQTLKGDSWYDARYLGGGTYSSARIFLMFHF